MPAKEPIYGLPYNVGSDLGRDIPKVSRQLAENMATAMLAAGVTPPQTDWSSLVARLATAEQRLAGLADSGWIRVPNSAIGAFFSVKTGNPVQYRKVGQIVFLSGQLYSATAPTAPQAVMTLPADARPANSTFVGGVLPWGHYNQIEPSGFVTLASNQLRTSSTGYPLDGTSFVIG